MAFSSSVFADLPAVPTTLPTIPTDFPTVPTTLPTIPTTNPTVPTVLPTIPSGNSGSGGSGGTGGSGGSGGTVTPSGGTTPTVAKYTFIGFRPPIVTNGVTNTVKGKVVRFGWNLKDASGNEIKDPAVVTGRSYKEIDCASAASKSDFNPRGIKLTKTLYSKGRKDLEFAWKVPNLSKSCLLFSVTFDGGQTASAKFYVK
ncbi:MAG TPA: hypothetical protein DCY52_00685 [Methylococcaceae bacterium]|nr:hypothetical protein [Methylococcaceae bacterium]